jgi:transposase InsO family protein
MCEALGVSRSGYYDWLTRPENRPSKRKKLLAQRINAIYPKSRGLYGSPKIAAVLKSEGFRVSRKTVSKIMREQGLRSKAIKPRRVMTSYSHDIPVAKNLLSQRFEASRPNEKWVADITYVKTKEVWMYLASVMDLYSRKVVGWCLDSIASKDLVLRAFDSAVKRQARQWKVLSF